MDAQGIREGVAIALDALRSNRVRAALTTLGVVIGVSTVMLMSALIGGMHAALLEDLEAMGPHNFSVTRFDMKPRAVSDERELWGNNPRITLPEMRLIAAQPGVLSASAYVYAPSPVRSGPRRLEQVDVFGEGTAWTLGTRGDFVSGRNFLPDEEERSAPVAVVSAGLAAALFGESDPVGRAVRIGGERFRVVGVYRPRASIFGGDQPEWARVPVTSALKRLDAREDYLQVTVVPESRTGQQRAIDEVTAALRTARRLRAADDNNFVISRNEEAIATFNRWVGVFFLIMLVLSSVGLLVGGVGVVAVMMISVTERTREIGVRKALGATRREILWQFLVESTTVTLVGAGAGMLLGGTGALLVRSLTPLPAAVPLWSVGAALGVALVSGVGFGLYPAVRASRLDPVDALRYE